MKTYLLLILSFVSMNIHASTIDTIQVYNFQCESPDPYEIDTTYFWYDLDTLFIHNVKMGNCSPNDLKASVISSNDSVSIHVFNPSNVMTTCDCSLGYTVKLVTGVFDSLTITIQGESFKVKYDELIKVADNDFAPIGASWHYTKRYAFSGNEDYLTYISRGDTLINDKICKIIYKDPLSCTSRPDVEYVYTKDSTVYFWDSTFNKFQILYDFNLQVGGSWKIEVESYDHIDTVKFIVDSIKYEYFNAQRLKILYTNKVIATPDYTYSEVGETNIIVYKLGNLKKMFNFDSDRINACDFDYIDGLRCYEDSVFGFYSSGFAPYCTFSHENLWNFEEYHPFAGEGAIWHSLILRPYAAAEYHQQIKTITLGDSIEFKGNTYLNIDSNHAIRERNRKIYVLQNEEEKLLYDFNMNVGDTIFYKVDDWSSYYKVVDSIGRITLNKGGDRFIWYLTTYSGVGEEQDIWIEGIGSVHEEGLLNPLFPFKTTDGRNTFFGCFKFNEILYTDKNNTVGDDCPCSWTLDVKNFNDEKPIMIYPNPAMDHITIKNNQKNLIDIQIIDMTGRTLKRMNSNNTETTINLDHVPSGLYSVRVNGESYKIIVK